MKHKVRVLEEKLTKLKSMKDTIIQENERLKGALKESGGKLVSTKKKLEKRLQEKETKIIQLTS
jgi:hypothetical protein